MEDCNCRSCPPTTLWNRIRLWKKLFQVSWGSFAISLFFKYNPSSTVWFWARIFAKIQVSVPSVTKEYLDSTTVLPYNKLFLMRRNIWVWTGFAHPSYNDRIERCLFPPRQPQNGDLLCSIFALPKTYSKSHSFSFDHWRGWRQRCGWFYLHSGGFLLGLDLSTIASVVHVAHGDPIPIYAKVFSLFYLGWPYLFGSKMAMLEEMLVIAVKRKSGAWMKIRSREKSWSLWTWWMGIRCRWPLPEPGLESVELALIAITYINSARPSICWNPILLQCLCCWSSPESWSCRNLQLELNSRILQRNKVF